MSLPPGPKAPSTVQLWRWLRRPFDLLDECDARFGDAFTLRLAGYPSLVILSNPAHVREVFSAGLDAVHESSSRDVLGPFLGRYSVLLITGDEHLRQRKLLTPPFHGERMQAYGGEMVAATHEAVDALPLGAPFAAQRPFQEIALRVILRTVFGLEGGAELARFGAALTELIELGTKPWLMVGPMRVDLGPWSPWGKFVRASAEADRLIYGELARRRAPGAARGSDVLSLLLDARDERGRPMSDHELRDELVTLLVAGHETTATSLAWAVHLLLGAPEAMAKLRAEVDGAWADGPPAPERVAKLEYLDAVVREALRLRPVLPIVGRVLAKPMRLAGYDLPAGARVSPSIYLTQRRAELYPEPRAFRPERFLGTKFSASEWYPFGGGVRRCIGMAFALYEMKMVLSTLLARVDLRRAPGPATRVVRRNVTLGPSGGLPVIVTRKRPRPPARAAA